MKHLLYILLSIIVFTACEDDKDTLPYPMNELDGTYWEFAKEEYLYYDEKGEFIEQRESTLSAPDYFFKGKTVLLIDPSSKDCSEWFYSIYWKDQRAIIGRTAFNLVEYNDSNLVIEIKSFSSYSIDAVSGSRSRARRRWYHRSEPEYSWEEYIKYYGEDIKHY